MILAESESEKGRQYFEQSNFIKAIEIFKSEIKNTGAANRAVSLFYLGRSYEKTGKREDAIKSYTTLLKDYPDNYLVQHALSRMKILNPGKDIDYKLVSTAQNNKLPQKSNSLLKNKKISVHPPQQKSIEAEKAEELFKQDYTYDDVLKAKETAHQQNVEKRIKENINDEFSSEKNIIIDLPSEKNTQFTPALKSETEKNLIKNDFEKKENVATYDQTNSVQSSSVRIPEQTVTEKLSQPDVKAGKEIQISFKTFEVDSNTKQAISVPPSPSALFDNAVKKFERQLYIDSLLDFKQYASKGDDLKKLEYAYYKIGEINHLLGYFSEALSGYLQFISKYEKSNEIYKAYLNIANIYYEAFGLLLPAKQYYLLALEKTDDIAVIEKIKIPLSEIENYIRQNKIEELKTAVKTPLSERIPEEKSIAKTVTQKETPDLQEKRIIDSRSDIQSSSAEIKQIEPSIQKGNGTDISQIIENRRDVNEYIAEGYKFKNLGMYEESIKNYKSAISIYPDHPTSYNNLAYLYAELDVNLDEALRLIQTAMNIDKSNSGLYLDTLGWIYYKSGNFNKAREVLEKAVFFNPSALRKYHLGLCLKQLNLNDKALIELQNARVMQPIGKLGEMIKNEIYSIQQ